MSKNVKIILIVVGILAFFSVACVGGLAIFGYYFVDNEGVDKSTKEGKEFGRTTDNLGCQTKVVPIIKSLDEKNYNEMLKLEYFFESCLETSRPTPNFCDVLRSISLGCCPSSTTRAVSWPALIRKNALKPSIACLTNQSMPSTGRSSGATGCD